MDCPTSRPEVVIAALLYLLTAHRARPCPGLASCIARHFAMLAEHPDAHRMIRDVASASAQSWAPAAPAPARREAEAALH